MKSIDLNNIFIQQINEHTFILDKSKKDYVIVDLGFCQGHFLSLIDISLPKQIKTYIGVDPNPNTDFEEVLSWIRSNNKNNFHLYRSAIYAGIEDFVDYYEIPHDRECNNIVAGTNSHFLHNSKAKKTQVQTIKLLDIINNRNIEKIDLLKIDIEGYEYDLIDSFTPELASRIEQISIEFHDFVNKDLAHENMKAFLKLKDLGFKMIYKRSTDGWWKSEYYDTLFVNTLI